MKSDDTQLVNPNKIPDIPSDVFVTEDAENFYKFYATLLASEGKLAHTDLFSLINMARTLDSITILRKDLNERPTIQDTADTPHGEKITNKENPLWRALADQEKIFEKYCKQFGLTPMSRLELEEKYMKNELLQAKIHETGKGQPSGKPKDQAGLITYDDL